MIKFGATIRATLNGAKSLVVKLSQNFFKKSRFKLGQRIRWRPRIDGKSLIFVSTAVLVISPFLGFWGEKIEASRYQIARYENKLIDEAIPQYALQLQQVSPDGDSFVFNEGYSVSAGGFGGDKSSAKFSAMFNDDGNRGVTAIEPASGVEFRIVPKFGIHEPRKDQNRIVQPLKSIDATKVFTLYGSAIKEDVILDHFIEDSLEFDYQIELPEHVEARLDADGSIGVYGIAPELLGNVSVGSEEDQQLLDKLRKNQEKNNLLFKIPAPFIVEADGNSSSLASAYFSMPENDTIKVHAVGLSEASYPISIDPSIYIETARKLMRGNNESNVDFDTTNELINKGFTTGARFDSWDNTTQLNEARWNGASAATGGFIYYAGGASEGAAVKTEFTSAGNTTYTVPAGVTSLTVKAWGAGGGGGGASPDRNGGDGGGGGYSSSTITVTPGETLDVYVGGAGSGGTGGVSGTNSGNGGGGGGYSGLFRTGTALLVASGGGGGGGGNADTGSTARQPGDDGGAGGGLSGITGDSNDTTTGGSGGTQSAGGAGGTAVGVAGSSLAGGDGGSNGTPQNNGGTNGGGDGGTQQNGGGPNKKPGGGGGGAGYYGGGGGGLRDSRYNGGAGGGGGSSYTTGSPATNAAGNGQDPGNKSDLDRGGAGNGGAGGTSGGNGAAGTAGKVVVIYSSGSGDSLHDDVYWAQLNDSTGSIDSPNPGDGACVNWCTSPDYALPAERQGHSMVAYNGYLYIFGGENESGTRQSTVWIAKLGVNGEPQLWHPTDTDKSNWVYWYADTSLPSERTYHSAVAYRNTMYLLGGTTNASNGGITTVHKANIEPDGTLGSWSTTGTTALPNVRFGHSVQIYNDYMYLIGGNSNGTLQNTVHYNKLDADGSMNAWYSTESFSDSRMSWGGNYATVYGGYLYLNGGCSAVNGSTGYCETVENDTQLASINADGTITPWGTIEGLTSLRIGHSLSSWRGNIYSLGGCTAQSGIDGLCTDIKLTNDYGSINQDGDASTVSDSVDLGTGTCTGADPYDCDTPPLGNGDGEGGGMAGGAVVNNGFIYYIGGCREVGGSGQVCTNGSSGRTSDTIFYAEIANDGTLRRPGTCTGTSIQYVQSWCVDNNNTVGTGGGNGLAAFGYTVFNNRIYLIGGTDGQTWQTDVWYTTLNNNGSLNAWTKQTLSSVGMGSSSLSYSYVFARANPNSAGTFPGNLYVIGGCNGSSGGLDCDTFYTTVYKCKIATSGALGTGGDACTTSGQTQIDAEPGTSGNQGLGIMAGAVYANYIYLIGGQSPNEVERGKIMYAKLDDSGNIVDPDGETTTDNIWETSSNEITPSRRRGVAFGYNGYLYALAGFAVDTGLNDLLFAKIDVSDGSIGSFTTSAVTVNQRWDLRHAVSSGYIYTFGGCSSGSPPATCNAMTTTVQTFQLYNNFSGSTSDYTSSANDFATDRIGASSAVVDGYLYIAGGCTSITDCLTATTSVQYAQLGNDGSIGSWSATTAGLPAARAWGQLETAGGDLYYLGGQSSTAGNAQSTIYYATPSSGDVSSWSTASGGIGDTSSQAAQARTEFSADVWNDRIYVVGGYDGSAITDDVFISPQLSSGGNIAADSWTEDTDVPDVARRGHTVMTYANNIYVLGGFDGTNYLSDVQYSQINSDGTIDAWQYTTSLPRPVRNADGFAVNGYMYLFGGRSAATTCSDNTYISPISANTTIASGNNPTGLGEWYQTREDLDGNDRYGATAAYNAGKAYVMGGACGSTLTYTGADRTLYATLFSQPQITRYSRAIDTDTDVFPTKWLMNGLDNDIGARWQLQYRSSTNANNAWGQNTNFGEITLGSVEDYIPLDGTGTDTDFARYYYFDIYIDASKTYGYPDDVNRGPTIDDLTLFFTSDPNKRLRHGKTFTGGEKQPLDTPPPN